MKKTTMRTKKVVRMPLRRNAQRTRPGSSLMPARAATADEAYDDEEDYGGEDEPNMKFSHAVLVVLILHVIAVGGIFAFNSIKARQTSEAKVNSKAAATAAAAASTTAPASATEPETTGPEKTTAAAPIKTTDKSDQTKATTGKTHTVQAGDTLTRVSTLYGVKVEDLEKENNMTSPSMLHVGQVLKIPSGKSDAKTAAPKTAATKPAPVKTTAAVDTITTADKTVPDKPVPVTTTTTAAAAPTEKVDQPGAHGTASGDTYVVVKGDNPYSIAKKFHVSYNDLLTANGIKDATKIQIGQKLKIPAKK